MAQSKSDLFEFVLRPKFDTENVDDNAKILSDELERIAEKISKQISTKIGGAFSNFNTKDINKVTEVVAQLGGQVTRTGTSISASFKDTQGNIIKVTDSVKTAIDVIEEYYQTLRTKGVTSDQGVSVSSALQKIQEFRTTGKTYTGSDEIKEQNQIEKEIIQNLEKRYQYETKIMDAKQQGNSVNVQYYTSLKTQLATERQELEKQLSTQNTVAKQNIANAEQELIAKRNVYQQNLQNQAAAEKENTNLTNSISLLNQYQSVQAKITQAETSGQKGSAYYQELEKQLQSIVSEMKQYGLVIDQATGKLTFDKTATSAVQAKENIDKVEKAVKSVGTSLDTTNAKAKDQKLLSTIKEYVKQYQTLQTLESQGKQDTQVYKDTQTAMNSLVSTLKQYGIEVQTSTNGTARFVVVQKNQENQTEQVTDALRQANVTLETHKEGQKSLSDSVQSSVENFLKYQVAMEAINKITSEFTSAIYDMNEAMTQVRMVTMGSYEDTVALADSYTKLAKQLGTTTTTVAEGADAWLRQGYSAQDAMEMLKQSTTLAVVGQLNASEATDQLTA